MTLKSVANHVTLPRGVLVATLADGSLVGADGREAFKQRERNRTSWWTSGRGTRLPLKNASEAALYCAGLMPYPQPSLTVACGAEGRRGSHELYLLPVSVAKRKRTKKHLVCKSCGAVGSEGSFVYDPRVRIQNEAR